MASRIVTVAVVAIAVALPAGAAPGASRPFWGLSGSSADAVLTLVDPVTLRGFGPGVRLGRFSGERALSTDGQTLAIAAQDGPVVRLLDVARKRVLGDVRLAEEGEVHVLRWTQRGLVAVVDPPRGSRLVWVDPERLRVTRVLRYRGELADFRLAMGRIAVVEWPADRVGPVRLDVIDPDGRARSTRVDRIRGGRAREGNDVVRVAEPGLAIDPEGERAWLADSDGEICAVVLDSLAVRCHAVRTLAKSGVPWSRRQLKLVGPTTLALSGWEKPTAGPRAARSIGLWLVEASTRRRRLVRRGIDSFRFAGGVIVGWRLNGVEAYGADGSRRYSIEEPLGLGVVSVVGAFLYVPRSDGRTVVAELATGRVLGRPVASARPFQDLGTW